MPSPEARIAEILHQAAETHHVVYRIVGMAAPPELEGRWLLELSELPALLGTKPVRSHLVHTLVELERENAEADTDERWESRYARGLLERFG